MRSNEIPPSGRNIDQCQKVEPQPSFKISTSQGRTSQEGHLTREESTPLKFPPPRKSSNPNVEEECLEKDW